MLIDWNFQGCVDLNKFFNFLKIMKAVCQILTILSNAALIFKEWYTFL